MPSRSLIMRSCPMQVLAIAGDRRAVLQHLLVGLITHGDGLRSLRPGQLIALDDLGMVDGTAADLSQLFEKPLDGRGRGA